MRRAVVAWRDQRSGRLSLGAIGLVLAYVAGSLAVDRGNPWFYAATLALVVVSIKELAGVFRKRN